MRYLFPKRIICSSDIENLDVLLKDAFLQVDLSDAGCIHLKDGDYFILDFGREINGGIRLLTSHIDPKGRVRLRFGESISEVNSEAGGPSGATNDHSPRDFEATMSAHMSDLTFGQTGFRFIRVDFHGQFWMLQHVVAALEIDEREEVGVFKSDDELLNEIWDVASYTLRLNLHNGVVWDGIKRDRLCWIGDCYNELRAMMCLYDKQDEIANVIDFSASSVETFFGQNYMIPSTYPLWWILVLISKYEHDFDKDYFLNRKGFAGKIITKTASYIHDNGDVVLPNNFIDWPSHPLNDGTPEDEIKRHDEMIGVKALTLLTFKSYLDALHSVDDHSFDDLIVPEIEKLKKGDYNVKAFKQCAAFAFFVGQATEHNRKILKEGGAHGLSTFQSFFILAALGEMGEYDLALKTLEDYYGSMLSLGATSFFEDYDIDWAKGAGRIDELPKDGEIDFHATYGQFCYKKLRHSLCHGWGVGVIPYVVHYIIGLNQVGEDSFVIEPHMSSLKHIDYTYPTSKGPLNIKIDVEDGIPYIELDKPSGIEVKITDKNRMK